MRNVLWDAAMFSVGFAVYPVIELLYRGTTHGSMALAGGLSMLLLGRVCALRMPAILRATLSCAGITFIEWVFGVVVNLYLQLGVWDYSALPYQFMGQVCLRYALAWFGLSLPLTVLLRAVKRRVFAPKRDEKAVSLRT